MASNDQLVVDSAAVRGAAAAAQSGASAAGTQPVAISPSAQDVTSVQVASLLGGKVSALINDTALANARAAAAAGRLGANADTYDEQEHHNAAALSDTSGSAMGAAVPVSRGPQPVAVPVAAPPAPAVGVAPTSGRHIAVLIHGGPGPAGLDNAAALLTTHAGQLDQAAGSIRSARWQAQAGWSSEGGDAAHQHLVNLESSYTDQAEQARQLAQHASTQAQNFRTARSQIPPPELFDELERRLLAANKANSAPGSVGRFTAAVVKYQTELAAANTQAVNGFGGYTRAAADVTVTPIAPRPAPTPAPAPRPAEPAAPTTGAPATPPVKGKAAEVDTGGRGVPTGDPVPGDPSPVGVEAPVGPLNDATSTLLPAVFGAFAGLGGGLLGALSGGAQKFQQAGTQLASGLAQGASSALGSPQAPGGGSPDTSGGPGSGGDPAGDEGGDLGGGGTEPASSTGGPLAAAPASAAAAPAAAPAMFSTASSPGALAAGSGPGGVPMGGAMMPPPMMGGRGGGSGQDDRKLYPERKLKIEAVPNSEPVRLRVEQRAARTDRGDGNT